MNDCLFEGQRLYLKPDDSERNIYVNDQSLFLLTCRYTTPCYGKKIWNWPPTKKAMKPVIQFHGLHYSRNILLGHFDCNIGRLAFCYSHHGLSLRFQFFAPRNDLVSAGRNVADGKLPVSFRHIVITTFRNHDIS